LDFATRRTDQELRDSSHGGSNQFPGILFHAIAATRRFSQRPNASSQAWRARVEADIGYCSVQNENRSCCSQFSRMCHLSDGINQSAPISFLSHVPRSRQRCEFGGRKFPWIVVVSCYQGILVCSFPEFRPAEATVCLLRHSNGRRLLSSLGLDGGDFFRRVYAMCSAVRTSEAPGAFEYQLRWIWIIVFAYASTSFQSTMTP
jgi:hypothetical protein